MHPTMTKMLATEHVRDMLASAAQARLARQARQSGDARRAWPSVRRTKCPEPVMEH
jgi:hypothetical protein